MHVRTQQWFGRWEEREECERGVIQTCVVCEGKWQQRVRGKGSRMWDV